MNTTEKLNYILKELKTVPIENIYKAKECIKEKEGFYIGSIDKLEKISLDQLKKYSFVSEVLNLSELKEKLSYTKKILNRVYRLECHKYAPELNKLNFIDKSNSLIEFKVQRVINITDAVSLFIKLSSLKQIKDLVRTCKVIK